MSNHTSSAIPEKQPLITQWISRVMGKEKLAHAYLFVGPKGSGKREMALYFTQAIFCPHASSATDFYPCGTCLECQRVQHGNHPDIHWVEPDGVSIKIEQIRQLQKEFSYRGVEANQKVYIIQQIEQMTTQAANSLLKFLEEPSPGTTALLLTEQKQRLLPTIISRCQEIKFPPPSPQQLIRQLADRYSPALVTLACHITADMEEASKLCEAHWFADLRNLVIQLIEENSYSVLQGLFFVQDKWQDVVKEREQVDLGLELLLLWYKDVLYCKVDLEDQLVYSDQVESLRKQAKFMSKEKIARGMEAILAAKKRLYAHVNPQLLLEQLVIRLQEG